MNINIIGEVVLTLITIKFKGGVKAFAEEGGFACAVPFKPNTALIYHPEMPRYFLEDIDALNAGSGSVGVRIEVTKDINFGGNIDEYIPTLVSISEELCERHELSGILFNPLNPLILYLSIPMIGISKDAIQDITSTFTSRLPSLLRGILMVGTEVFPFAQEGCYEVAKPRVIIEPDRTDITQEAITDLRITLANDLDVNEIINML